MPCMYIVVVNHKTLVNSVTIYLIIIILYHNCNLSAHMVLCTCVLCACSLYRLCLKSESGMIVKSKWSLRAYCIIMEALWHSKHAVFNQEIVCVLITLPRIYVYISLMCVHAVMQVIRFKTELVVLNNVPAENVAFMYACALHNETCTCI